MYKSLFILLYKLIVQPVAAWDILITRQDKNNENFYKSYLFPIVGIIALFSFIGVLFSVKTFDVQLALKVVLKEVMIYGGGFYLASFVLSEYIYPRFGLEKDKSSAERFTGYGSSAIYIIAMFKALFPSLFILDILAIYTVYIIWTGAAHFLKLKENQWIKFTIFASILIMLTPFLLHSLINLLMPGMRI
ncbi:MAG: hypothetical protein LIO93_03595 [Bacteroidales bacterium]|nr:hypothetical protein [Bacteroidales bacterium]